MRVLIAVLALFFLLLPAHAQEALVVQTCGTLPQAYSAGATRLPTVDVNGNLCLNSANGVFNSVVISPPSGITAAIMGTTNGAGTTPAENCGANSLVEFAFNCLQTLSDTISAASKSIFGLDVYHYYNGSSATSGNPGGLGVYLEVAGTPGATQMFSATQIVAQADVSVSSGGYLYGLGAYCIIGANATGWTTCEGGEIDIKIQTGATVTNKVGFNITSIAGDAVQGSTVDSALIIDTSGTSPAPGWKEAIRIGGYNSTSISAISSGGAVMTTYASVATTLATGIDLSGKAHSGAGYTYSGNAININTTNFWSGAGVIASSGYLEITGTSAPTFAAGMMAVAGELSTPTLAAGGEGIAWLTAGGGYHITGYGTTNDVTIQNGASNNVMVVPHGVLRVVFSSSYGTACVAIASLPAAPSEGDRTCVTNGVAVPTYLGAVSTTGSTVAGVMYNGSGWVYD